MSGSRLLPLVVLLVSAVALAMLGIADQAGWPIQGLRLLRLDGLEWAVVFVIGWTLMTSAMMLPSSIPFLAAVHRVGGVAPGWVAAVAYVVAWGGLGALLCGLLWVVGDGLFRLPPGAAETLAGASLLAAAGYQLTPLSQKCQRACARPFGILARHWRGGHERLRSAWAAGLHYGISCIGCCVAMIVLMGVVGLHDLLWMLVLAGSMVVQKNVRWGRNFARGTAVVLGPAGVAIMAGWWTPALHGLRAVCG